MLISVAHHAHPVDGKSNIQHSANWEAATLHQGWARHFEMTESERDK